MAPSTGGAKAIPVHIARYEMLKAGGKAENIVLPAIGIRGNSHMFMQDRNGLVVADWLLAWIDGNIEHRSGKQGGREPR